MVEAAERRNGGEQEAERLRLLESYLRLAGCSPQPLADTLIGDLKRVVVKADATHRPPANSMIDTIKSLTREPKDSILSHETEHGTLELDITQGKAKSKGLTREDSESARRSDRGQ